MNATAAAAAPSRTGETELFPYRLSLPRTLVPKADFLVTISLLGDLAVILGALSLGYWFRFNSGLLHLGNEPAGLVFGDYVGLISLGTLFLLLTFGYLQLYNPRKIPGFRDAALIVTKGATFWLFAFVSISLVLKFQPTLSRVYVFTAFLTTITLLFGWRWLFSQILRTETLGRTLRKRALFIGWTPEASRIAELMGKDRDRPFEVAGWIPAPLDLRAQAVPSGVPELGNCTELPHLLHRHEIDAVILTDPRLGYDEIVALANMCEKELVEFKVIPSYFQILLSGLKLESISGVPILGVAELPLNRVVNRLLKRAVDIVGALVGLTLAAPIIFVCGLLVYLESPGPIFFRQVRTGRNGQNFKIIKLRSMKLNAETDTGPQWAVKDDPRRLRIGAFMREWNFDEVPQFWNVLKGEMSLVGPRPERPELILNFKNKIPHYNARLASKPGLTGWAQVNGLRGDTSLEERVRYDLHYLENWSLWFDISTMIQTFFRRENAY